MRTLNCTFLVLTSLLLIPQSVFAQKVTAKMLLEGYKPRQRSANVETPKPAAMAQCKTDVVKDGGGSGYVVYGPAGQVLRRFTDTDKDEKVDQFRYYRMGVEVYRDIDTDGDEKIDQFRWLNAGGTRWGVDKDGDNRIDEWKRISAQEAAQVAVMAMITGDMRMLQTVMVNRNDIQALGLKGGYADKAAESVADASTRAKAAAAQSKSFSRGNTWMRFDAQSPGVIPAGKVSSRDLTVYENAMAMVDSKGKPLLIHVGELVQVGNNWKLLTVPQGSDGEITAQSVLVTPELMNPGAGGGTGGAAPNAAEQKLLAELGALDKSPPKPTDSPRLILDYNKKRAAILQKLVSAAPKGRKPEYIRQLADGLAAAVAAAGRTPGGWPDGLKLLQGLEKQVKAGDYEKESEAYVVYRRMMADYATRLAKADAVPERQEIQEWWLDELPKFARQYPNAEDAPDALIELAKNYEFQGKIDEAERAYSKVKNSHPDSDPSKLATGALFRFQLEGRSLPLSGTDLRGRKADIAQYKGKVTLVVFWTTWCIPCKQELPQLVGLHRTYQRNGFEILGVNLDEGNADVAGFLRQNKVSWNHIRDSAGMQGGLGQKFGIISLPTMILVGKDGKVLSRSISLGELKEGLPDVLRGKPLKKSDEKEPPPVTQRRKTRKRNN